MSVIVTKAKEQIEKIVNDAVLRAVDKGELEAAELSAFKIDVPQNREHGDYAVNAAMVWSKAFHNNPRKIAEILSSNSFISAGGVISLILARL